jgi:hypothetical protein
MFNVQRLLGSSPAAASNIDKQTCNNIILFTVSTQNANKKYDASKIICGDSLCTYSKSRYHWTINFETLTRRRASNGDG